MDENEKPGFLDGFLKMVAVYWYLIIACIICLGCSYWALVHVDSYVQDCNTEWQTQLAKYDCFPKGQVQMPGEIINPLIGFNFTFNQTDSGG